MNLNWGHGIVATIVAFVLMMSFMVYKAVGESFDLVSPDYYAQEIAYQGKIDKLNGSAKLTEKIQVSTEGGKVKLVFPAVFAGQVISGTANFFCPSNATRDFNIPLNLDTSLVQIISDTKLTSGYYKIQIDWAANQTTYFQEQNLIMP